MRRLVAALALVCTKMCLKHDSLVETAFRVGVALVFIGVLVFFGATPRGISANPVGAAWILAIALVTVGFILIGIHRYSHK